jgi:hypothetical protein
LNGLETSFLCTPGTTHSCAASTPQGSLYTAPLPHHPDDVYRPLLPSTVGYQPDHGQTGSAGYSCSPYSMPPTFLQLGITSLGHVARCWAREGHDGISPLWANMPYNLFPWYGPTPCGTDSEMQDYRLPLTQPGERQMQAPEGS